MQPGMGTERAWPTTVRFRFTKADGHKTVAANGAWGGATPSGEIHVHLYLESPEVPAETEAPIGPSGPLQEKLPGNGETIVVEREVQVSVVMSAPKARDLALWLIRKCDELDEVRKGMEEADANP